MKSVVKYIITETVKQKYRVKRQQRADADLQKEVHNTSIAISHGFRNAFLSILGIISASFGLKGFLLPNSFIDGGVTGISLIVTEVSGIDLSILLVIINLPFLALGFNVVSGRFTFKSILAIICLAIMVHFIQYPVVTEDKLLISVFGGFFLGLGIGLAMRGGCVLDGTEILAVYLSRKTSLTVGDVILVFNILIFGVAAYIFTVEVALYAILTYLAAAKTVDFVVDGIEEYFGVTIISEKNEQIRLAIIENLGRGCTIYTGKRGFAKRGEPLKPVDIVYTLITRLELSKLQKEVKKIDENAFIIMHSIKDAKGGMIKKKPLKK